jgi:hypothetical protein
MRPLLGASGQPLAWAVDAAVQQLSLPSSVSAGVLALLQTAFEDVAHQARSAGTVRLEAGVLHGETGSHLHLLLSALGGRHAGAAAQKGSHGDPARLQRQATQIGAQLEVSNQACRWQMELVLQISSP